MAKTVVTKQTVSNDDEETTTGSGSGKERIEKPVKTEEPHTVTHLFYYLLGVVEILLALRFFLRLSGANPDSGFVTGIYALTSVFVAPFKLIFSRATGEGVETTAVFEPETLIAMLVYALIVWGIAKLVQVGSGRAHEEE